jgi:hypothetical protein
MGNILDIRVDPGKGQNCIPRAAYQEHADKVRTQEQTGKVQNLLLSTLYLHLPHFANMHGFMTGKY